jgi:hypothetical protein
MLLSGEHRYIKRMDQVTKETFKALRISAISGDVLPIDIPFGEEPKIVRQRLQSIYAELSMPGLKPCSDINTVRVDDRGHFLYVDGEGVLKDPERFILWKGYPQALAGHALVVRIDRSGASTDVKVSEKWVKDHVKLARLKMLGFVQRTEVREIFGRKGTALINIPVFVPREGNAEPLTMEKIAEHLGFPGEKLEWTVLPSEDDLDEWLTQGEVRSKDDQQ